MSDETVIVKGQGTIFLGGPPLVKAATGEEVSAEELGGRRRARAHERRRRPLRARRGRRPRPCARHRGRRSPPARSRPGRSRSRRSRSTTRARSAASCPRAPRRAYDVREVIARIVDGSRFSEFKALYGHDAGHRLRAHHGLPGGHPRQQRRPLLRERAQGHALHLDVLPAADRRSSSSRTSPASSWARSTSRRASPRTGPRWSTRWPTPRCRSSPWSSAAASAPATTACAGAPTSRGSSGCGRTRGSA